MKQCEAGNDSEDDSGDSEVVSESFSEDYEFASIQKIAADSDAGDAGDQRDLESDAEVSDT